MKSRYIYSAATLVCTLGLFLITTQCTSGSPEHKAAKNNSGQTDAGNAHDGHDHGDHEPPSVKITKMQADQFGIKVADVVQGTVKRIFRVPGEVKLDEERIAHIVVQLSGVVRSAPVKIGDTVKAGQVLAVLESRELAETKSTFLAAVKRERLAREFFEREERLWQKQVTSEQEYLTALQALAERNIEKNSAYQQLLALGVPQKSIDDSGSAGSPISRFELRAPISGRVLKKHLTLGESVQSGTQVFMIADLNTVWLDLSVSNENLPELREGLPIEIEHTGTQRIESTISFVSPVVESETRTALVRAVVKNEDGSLRPGLFVQANIQLPAVDTTPLVLTGSIQMINDHPCVFVWKNGVFELREVVPGISDKQHTQILSGLKAGELVVAENAFHLKAEYIKSAAGDLGGCHGHSH